MKVPRFKGILATAVAAGFMVMPMNLQSVSASGMFSTDKYCNPFTHNNIMCENFLGKTFFKNGTPSVPWATWYKYPFNPDNAVKYIDRYMENTLRLQVDENTTVNNYSNADISTSEINNYQGNFRFGVNTRAEVRMKFSANMQADPANAGAARGSAGFLFWDYFSVPVSPEMKDVNKVRDAFGFVWQDSTAIPTPGFWLAAVGQGQAGQYLPEFDLDISKFHTYAVERRHDSMKFFIDDALVLTQPLNQEGGIPLPDEQKLSTDIWVDNATYVLDFSDYQVQLEFNKLTEKQFIDVDYVQVTRI
jgi:hypothetical protein